MVVSTYQSVSGAGVVGIEELEGQWAKLDGATEQLRRAAPVDALIVPGAVWSKPIAGNVIPLAGSVKEAGYTSEEWKLVHESRKILHNATMRVHRDVRAGPRCTSGTRCRRTSSSAGR